MIKEIKRFACACLFILTIIVLAFYEELHIFLSAGFFSILENDLSGAIMSTAGLYCTDILDDATKCFLVILTLLSHYINFLVILT